MRLLVFDGLRTIPLYSVPFRGEPPVVEGAEECCDMCAKVVPLRPYSPPCRFFAFENTTKKCYLKDAKAMDGKVEKEGWTSGQVVLV